jgi:hypothetical protein
MEIDKQMHRKQIWKTVHRNVWYRSNIRTSNRDEKFQMLS